MMLLEERLRAVGEVLVRLSVEHERTLAEAPAEKSRRRGRSCGWLWQRRRWWWR
jgi:hypothetical protein